jgi:hypothetical protein
MKSTQSPDPTSLRAACYEISMAKDVPDAALLDEVVRRYPQFAGELTEFAILVALDALRERSGIHEVVAPEGGDSVSPAVSRAMSRFHNCLNAEGLKSAAPAKKPAVSEEMNPFSGLSRKEFRDLAARLDTTTVFVSKLRDREISPDTMTVGFREYAAAEMNVPVELLNAHLNAIRGSAVTPARFHKADGKPSHGERQTFEEAVRSSGMSEEQQRKFLAL